MTGVQKLILGYIGVKIANFPEDIVLDYIEPNKLLMKLKKEAAGFSKQPLAMQDDRACFEAWCLLIKAKTNKPELEIELDVEGITNASCSGGKPANGYMGKFLYRILKFNEQYKRWFKLAPTLEALKDKFKIYLASHSFVANVPTKEAEKDLANLLNMGLESYVAYLFCDSESAKRNILALTREAIVGRQLPVGLVEGSKASGKELFAGEEAAIDFWAVDENTINVYELKSKKPMLGIITESFFYSNYVYDVFISKNLNHGKGSVAHEAVAYRNYDKIQAARVKGIMINDNYTANLLEILVGTKDDIGWHRLLNSATRDEIKKVMNSNGTNGKIQYDFVSYTLKELTTNAPKIYYIAKQVLKVCRC